MAKDVLVLITTSFPIASDGSEAAGSFVVDLVDELANLRPVRVVAPGRVSCVEERHTGVEVFRYWAPIEPLSTLSVVNPHGLAKIFRVLHEGLVATQRAVAPDDVAHILALWALPSGYWARHVAQKKNLPYSVWTLGSDIWSLGKLPVVRSYLQRVLKGASNCYSDGYQLRDDTQLLAEREVEMLPSARRLDVQRVTSRATAPPYRLLYLGRWHPNKGVDILLNALHLLGDSDWRNISEVHIAGGGPLESLVREHVTALQDRGLPMKLSGYLDREQAAIAFSHADILCLPSRIESIPVVFSDAVRAGLSVVACPVGDLPRLLAKGGGRVAEDISPSAFAKAIAIQVRQCIHNEELTHLNELAGMFDISSIAGHINSLTQADTDDQDLA